MNRKYVVVTIASVDAANLVEDRIFDNMNDAKALRDEKVTRLVNSVLTNSARGAVVPDYASAVQSAKSFIKVYELVAVEI